MTKPRVIYKIKNLLFFPLHIHHIQAVEDADKEDRLLMNQMLGDAFGKIRHHQGMDIGRRMNRHHEQQTHFLKTGGSRNLNVRFQKIGQEG